MDTNENTELFFMQYKGGTIVLNCEHQYHKLRNFKNGSSIWRCSTYKKSKCPGTITIKGEQLIKKSEKSHTCETQFGRNLVAKEIAKLKKKVTECDKPITQLYDEACIDFEDKGLNFVTSLPPLSSVQHCLYNTRNKTIGVQKTVYKSLEEVRIPLKFHDYIVADYYYNGSRILVFCSPDCRKLIGNITEFFGDATFKSCPLPFGELYSIHGDIGSTLEKTNVIPLIFALLPNKKQETYVTLFSILKSALPDWAPQTFHCDFELAAINALSEVYPNVLLKGCYYHWTRAIWKKAKALGYNKRKGQKRIIGLTAVLPLLPADDIERGWDYIKVECQDLEMQNFVKYVERFWLKKDFKNLLSVYGLRHRTNNVLEGWHSKLNKRVTKGTVTLARLLKLIADFRKTKSLTSNKGGRKRTNISIQNDDYIISVLMQFISGEITVGYTLEKLR